LYENESSNIRKYATLTLELVEEDQEDILKISNLMKQLNHIKIPENVKQQYNSVYDTMSFDKQIRFLMNAKKSLSIVLNNKDPINQENYF